MTPRSPHQRSTEGKCSRPPSQVMSAVTRHASGVPAKLRTIINAAYHAQLCIRIGTHRVADDTEKPTSAQHRGEMLASTEPGGVSRDTSCLGRARQALNHKQCRISRAAVHSDRHPPRGRCHREAHIRRDTAPRRCVARRASQTVSGAARRDIGASHVPPSRGPHRDETP
jgi:hypothetical protein